MTRAPGACVPGEPAPVRERRVAAVGHRVRAAQRTDRDAARRPGQSLVSVAQVCVGVRVRAAYPAGRSGPTLIHPPLRCPPGRPPGPAAPAALPGA